MSLDSTVPIGPSYPLVYGITVTVMPYDSVHPIEVWRAPDAAHLALEDGSGLYQLEDGSGDFLLESAAGAGPNDAAAVLVTVLPPSSSTGVVFIDPLPNDNVKRYYKSRHVDEVGNFSAFTTYSDGQVPVLITNSGASRPNPMAAFGAIVDVLPPATRYELRMAGSYPDPDLIEGLQSYIDFPASSNFMRLGQAPLAVTNATNASPIQITTSVNHGYQTGDVVTVRGVLGNLAANGTWTVTIDAVDPTKFTLTTPTSTGSGAYTSGGHVVKLSLTVDPVGNLTVYAVIKAVALTVLGIATFLGTVIMQSALRVATLQQPVGGLYNDTAINRVLIEGGGDLKVYGDAGTGTNNEAVRLGTYTVPLGTLTARSTINQTPLSTTHAGWNDPDGIADGVNTLTLAAADNQTVAAGNRLYNTAGDPSAGSNLPSFDNNYTVKFTLSATANGISGLHTETVDAICTLEFSTNGGSTYTALSGSYSVEANVTSGGTQTTTQTFTVTVNCPGAPGTGFRLRLKLQGISGGNGAGGSASVRVYNATGWGTDPWPVTWQSTSGATKARRGAFLRATSDGTDNQPHAYLEPQAALTPDANAAGGEIEAMKASQHTRLYAHDGTRFQPQREFIGAVSNLSQVTNALQSKGQLTVDGGLLRTNGDAIILQFHGQIPNNTGTWTFQLKFGNTIILTATLTTPGVVATFSGYAAVIRTGATTQIATSEVTFAQDATNVTNPTVRVTRTTPAETLATDVTLDFSLQGNGTNAILLDYAGVWLATV